MTMPKYPWFIVVLSVGLLTAGPLYAISTRNFSLDTPEAFNAGELKHAMVDSNGTITPGASLTRVGLEGVPVAYCFERGPDGSLYVGTGNDGKVYRLKGGKPSVFAETGQLLVTSLVFGMGGKLFAGTLPEGHIYVLEPDGKAKEFTRLKDVNHVWDLAYDPQRQVIYAATGPQGKIFSINASGKAQLYVDSKMTHIMRLALDGNTLYAGTSDEAILYRIQNKGRAEVVYDFPGSEITGLSVREGVVGVSVNEFAARSDLSKNAKKVEEVKKQEAQTKATPSASKVGKGQLWVIHANGWAEQRVVENNVHFTSVQLDQDGNLYAGTGVEGKIIKVTPEGRTATWIDIEERQVLAFDLLGKEPVILASDTAAVYEVGSSVAKDASWTSKVLDAEFHSQWGELAWRGDGKLSFQTRSGNTERPDETWSSWSTVLHKPGPIRSPAARFLQLRANMGSDSKSLVRAVQAYYLPQNQRARVLEVKVKSTKAEPVVHAAEVERPANSTARSSVIHLQWNIANPDNDSLRYELGFRTEHQTLWRNILEPGEKLVRPEYKWETAAIADGYYRLRVEASDEEDNPKTRALTSVLESGPILVDNHAPTISKLRLAQRRLLGVVQDTVGPIASLHYAIDGASWQVCYSADDLLDTRYEHLDLELPMLKPGPHVVAVRAIDAAGNVASSELTFTVR